MIAGTTQSRLKAALEEKNLRYHILELYTTRPSLSPLTTDFPHFAPHDIVAFTSPSAVDVFALHVAAVPGMKRLKTAALGPTTALALKKIGFEPIVSQHSGHWPSLVDQIKKEVRS